MGMSFSAGKISNFCTVCKRADYEKFFEIDKRMFKESPETKETKNDRVVFVYRGAPKLFSQHIENCEYYARQEAIEKWKAVKKCIDKKVYKKVKNILKDGDGFIYAWW